MTWKRDPLRTSPMTHRGFDATGRRVAYIARPARSGDSWLWSVSVGDEHPAGFAESARAARRAAERKYKELVR